MPVKITNKQKREIRAQIKELRKDIRRAEKLLKDNRIFPKCFEWILASAIDLNKHIDKIGCENK
jgi:hypothetical protein